MIYHIKHTFFLDHTYCIPMFSNMQIIKDNQVPRSKTDVFSMHWNRKCFWIMGLRSNVLNAMEFWRHHMEKQMTFIHFPEFLQMPESTIYAVSYVYAWITIINALSFCTLILQICVISHLYHSLFAKNSENKVEVAIMLSIYNYPFVPNIILLNLIVVIDF